MTDTARLVGERLARVMALDHLEREFEKVHDALPDLVTRVAVVEKWQTNHPDTHRLESVALTIAKEATDKEMVKLNDVRNRFVDKEEYRREHTRTADDIRSLRESRSLNTGEKTLLEKIWPLLLALGTGLIGHFWK